MKNAALSECQYIASCVHSPIVVSLKQKGMAYEIFHWCYKAMLRYRSHQMSCSFYLLYFHWCYKAMYSCRITFSPLLFRMLRYRSHQMSCSFYLLYYRPIFGKINIVMQNLYLNLHVGNLFGEPKRLNIDTRIFSLFYFSRHILTVKWHKESANNFQPGPPSPYEFAICIFIIDFATRHAKCIDKPLQIGIYDLFQM